MIKNFIISKTDWWNHSIAMLLNSRNDPEVTTARRNLPVSRTEDAAFNELLELITNGELLPGSRIAVAEFATRFGVSATPVRMALSRLAELGLVETIPHRGARVSKISIEEIRELYEVRRILEGSAARIAAEQISSNDIFRLEAEWGKFQSAIEIANVTQSYEVDEEFFNILFSSAQNKTLKNIITNIHHKLKLYKLLWFSTAMHKKNELKQLKPALIEACKLRSGSAAETAMSDFLSRAELQLIQLVQVTFNRH